MPKSEKRQKMVELTTFYEVHLISKNDNFLGKWVKKFILKFMANFSSSKDNNFLTGQDIGLNFVVQA